MSSSKLYYALGVYLFLFLPFSLYVKHEVGKATPKENPIEIGETIEPFSVRSLKGEELSLDVLLKTHEKVYLQFWATWCIPCHLEIPHLSRTYAKYKDSNVAVIGISLDGNLNVLVDYVEGHNLTFPVALGSELAQKLKVRTIPFGILIGKDKKVEEIKSQVNRGYQRDFERWNEQQSK